MQIIAGFLRFSNTHRYLHTNRTISSKFPCITLLRCNSTAYPLYCSKTCQVHTRQEPDPHVLYNRPVCVHVFVRCNECRNLERNVMGRARHWLTNFQGMSLGTETGGAYDFFEHCPCLVSMQCPFPVFRAGKRILLTRKETSPQNRNQEFIYHKLWHSAWRLNLDVNIFQIFTTFGKNVMHIIISTKSNRIVVKTFNFKSSELSSLDQV